MKKDNLIYAQLVKNCEMNQLVKLWTLILKVLSSYPSTVHIYR